MKLIHETVCDYIKGKREDVRFYVWYIASLEASFTKHKNGEEHDNCETCNLFIENIETNKEFLEDYKEELSRARKGLYE